MCLKTRIIEGSPDEDRKLAALEAAIDSYKKRIPLYERTGEIDMVQRMHRLIAREKETATKIRRERIKRLNQ